MACTLQSEFVIIFLDDDPSEMLVTENSNAIRTITKKISFSFSRFCSNALDFSKTHHSLAALID